MAAANMVETAMILCGVSNAANGAHGSNATRIASDIFDDEFTSCLNKTFGDLNTDLKSYSNMTVNQGQIRLTPGMKNKIKAFIQWCRDEICLGRNPADTV